MAQNGTDKKIALIAKDVEYMRKGVDRLEGSIGEVKKNTEQNFVTKAEFAPVKQVVYGIIGLILMAVMGALVSLVILK